MNQRTTIGGTVYESVGSNTSNLLLRCNGTARIQWGNKLIDLIKNGKLAVDDSSTKVSIVNDESEIKHDGLYVVKKDKSQQLFVCKSGERYNLTGADLYISANTKQDLTVEQKKQAQENIGICYNTLNEAMAANIQSGIVYIVENKQLYTANKGILNEFEAKLKTVAVEKENEEGEVITSSYKIVLSVSEKDYLILESDKTTCTTDFVISDGKAICSSNASQDYGFRLYVDNNQSTLEVDNLKVRNVQNEDVYVKITYNELVQSINTNSLKEQQYYLITDFQNHWNLHSDTLRPILVKAQSKNSLCKYGCLYNCNDVIISYDYNYTQSVTIEGNIYKTKGIITWMKDPNNNEANFDFLDYQEFKDSNNIKITTLHNTDFSQDKSIFPTGSYNNKLTVSNLWGTVIKNGVIDNTQACRVDFQFIDSGASRMQMYDNVLQCSGSGIILAPTCSKFYNNIFGTINNVNPIQSNICNCKFMDITNCIFGQGNLTNIVCRTNLENQEFLPTSHELLYDINKSKDIYLNNAMLNITSVGEQLFYRGMIIMHSGFETVPYGWAVCDGQSHSFNGESITTPNLVGRFIKAVGNKSDVGSVDIHTNNEVTLSASNLPEHSHPHTNHSHSFSGSDSSTISTATGATQKQAITTVEGGTSGFSGDDVTLGNKTISISISGTTGQSTSCEETQSWENESFSIEPNYYSLIFIMKL